MAAIKFIRLSIYASMLRTERDGDTEKGYQKPAVQQKTTDDDDDDDDDDDVDSHRLIATLLHVAGGPTSSLISS